MRVSGFTVAAAVGFLILIALGTWQLHRRAEKEALIAQYDMALNGPASSFPPAATWGSIDFQALENAKVEIEGRFRASPEIHLYALLPMLPGRRGGVGWWVIMLYDLSGGKTIFVNRGFVPQELKNPHLRPQSLPAGAVERLEGMIRLPEKANLFTPANDTSKNEWYLRDPKAFAAFAGLDSAPPIVIEQLTPNPKGLPQASDGILNLPNHHLEYALTWYALAIFLLVIWGCYTYSRTWQNRPD